MKAKQEDTLDIEETQRNYLDNIFLQLDQALDVLPGPTAAMLRLYRFSYWYNTDSLLGESNYERELERLVKGLEGPVKEFVYSVDYRYKMMWAMSPTPRKGKACSRELWHQTYPRGLNRFNDPLSRIEFVEKQDKALEACEEKSLKKKDSLLH